MSSPFKNALDFGSGDGWFASRLQEEGLVTKVVAIDIQQRRECYLKPIIYSGKNLPFDDQSFQLTYCIDVLHHCLEPITSLREIMRCTQEYIVIKDHTYQTFLQRLFLCILDEFGNRGHGITGPYNYQKGCKWFKYLESEVFRLEHLIHPAECHPITLNWATSKLHFIAVWRRQTNDEPTTKTLMPRT